MQQSIRQQATRIRMINPRFIHLSLIVIDRAYQHKNIGSRLLERIETYCQDFECQYIELVPIPDRNVKEFYQKKGYISDYRRGFWMKYFERKSRPRSDRYPYRPI
jgi:GNAT superfamily N-acetyltransferase